MWPRSLKILTSLLLLCLGITARAHVVDLHSHLASHLAYGFLLFGGDPESAPPEIKKVTHQHKHHQQLYREWLLRSGVQLHLMAAIPNVFALTRDIAWAQVEEQLKYVEDFVSQHPKEFVLAKNPKEARTAMEQGKIVLLHAIEGGEYLLDTPEDAQHWARRGVAMIGPIHLVDNEYGGASVMTGGRSLLNWKGILRSEEKGLSPEGKQAIEHMMKAGLIIDTAHMSSKSLDETIAFARPHRLPLVMSHGFFRAIREEERGLTDAQIRELLDLGSLMGLTLGGATLTPLKGPAHPACASGSVADFHAHSEFFSGKFSRSSLALGTDFNGFVDHLAPCPTQGKGIWETGVRTPVDLGVLVKEISPTLWENSAEKFLEIWERALEKKTI